MSCNPVSNCELHSEHGTVYTVRLLSRKDLDRQLVKSSTCTVTIPEYELTIPPGKGQLTTVEGLLRDVIQDLEVGQPLRRIEAEAAYNKIQTMLDAFKSVLGDEPDDEADEGAEAILRDQDKDSPLNPTLSVLLDDPSGNSFIEFEGSTSDPKWNLRTYTRSRQQNVDLGLVPQEDVSEVPEDVTVTEAKKVDDQAEAEESLSTNEGEIYAFPGSCSSCGAPLNTLMKKVNIPYFKVCTISSFMSSSRC